MRWLRVCITDDIRRFKKMNRIVRLKGGIDYKDVFLAREKNGIAKFLEGKV
jgi:hypothetical protein